MGTSQSSKGPSGQTPIVPPWVPDLPSASLPSTQTTSEPAGAHASSVAAPVSQTSLVTEAPPRRFTGVRRSLGDFALHGGSLYMRRGLRHYVRNGYGGASTATRRHGSTVRTAADLYEALDRSEDAKADKKSIDLESFKGRSAKEIINAVIEAIRPVDGTQDAEASRLCIKDALADLLESFPEADLLALDENQRMFVIERYVAFEIFRRFELDAGITIHQKASSPRLALAYLKEIRDYIREAAAAAFRSLRMSGQKFTSDKISGVVQAALQKTFLIFENYSE